MSAALQLSLDVSGRSFPDAEPVRLPSSTAADLVVRGRAPIGYLIRVTVNGEMRRLRMPLKYEIEQHERAVSVFAPAVLLGASGSTIDEAVDRLAKLVVQSWREYMRSSPKDLHASAVAQAMKLRHFLGA